MINTSGLKFAINRRTIVKTDSLSDGNSPLPMNEIEEYPKKKPMCKVCLNISKKVATLPEVEEKKKTRIA